MTPGSIAPCRQLIVGTGSLEAPTTRMWCQTYVSPSPRAQAPSTQTYLLVKIMNLLRNIHPQEMAGEAAPSF